MVSVSEACTHEHIKCTNSLPSFYKFCFIILESIVPPELSRPDEAVEKGALGNKTEPAALFYIIK